MSERFTFNEQDARTRLKTARDLLKEADVLTSDPGKISQLPTYPGRSQAVSALAELATAHILMALIELDD